MQQFYNPYGQYQKQQNQEIEFADPIRLITLLLEGAIRFGKKAMLATENGRKVEALEALDRAVKIVVHLYSCLDFDKGDEVAQRLGSLYSYIIDQQVYFSRHPTDTACLRSINEVLNLILDGWREIEKKTKNG